jgi:hypothetical protein
MSRGQHPHGYLPVAPISSRPISARHAEPVPQTYSARTYTNFDYDTSPYPAAGYDNRYNDQRAHTPPRRREREVTKMMTGANINLTVAKNIMDPDIVVLVLLLKSSLETLINRRKTGRQLVAGRKQKLQRRPQVTLGLLRKSARLWKKGWRNQSRKLKKKKQ